MPREVADQIVKDLDQGPKILSALATAAHLIAAARGGEAGLRLVESAAYNLREALDAVVAGQAAGKGGIPAIRDALGRYRVASSDPETSEDAALRSLADDLLRLESDGELLGFRSRQFLAWLEARTGIKPLPGADNPSNQFTALRDDVNKVLHDAGALPAVAGYYDDAINWFTRMFTPPDNRVHAIVDLARTPFTGPAQIAALRGRIAYNAHHLVRFLSEVRDPAWLDALLDDGLIGPPRDGEPWPVAALIGGAGGIAPTHVIALFQRIRAQAARGDRDQFSALDRELMELSFRLGPDPAAQALAVTIVHKRASDHWVQTIGVFLAGDADPSSPIQAAIADAVIANDTTTDGRYKTRTMSKLLVEGLNEENARERLSLLAHKLAKLAAEPRVKYFPPSTAALNTPERSGDRPDELAIVAQSLTSAIPVSRDLGLSTSDILELVAPIGGKVGERVICQVLAGAPDASREMKLAHLRTRLTSSTATGDDRDLLADLGELAPDEVDQLSAELGQPSPQPDPDERGFLDIPRDWRRAWGWSTVLPPEVLGRWDQPIAAVTERHGPPDDYALDRQLPSSIAGRPDSPYTTEQLSELPPIDGDCRAAR